MDIKQLRSFVAIVDYHNFSRAAEKLNISQSTISTHLLQLEKELNARLVYRTTQNVEITEEGRTVYKYAVQILEMMNCVYQSCTGEAKHFIRIGASAIPATYILPEVLSKYNSYCPKDNFLITQCDGSAVVEGVADGRFDVGITSHHIHRDGLRFVPLCADKLVMITPATERYIQMQNSGTRLKELLKEPIIMGRKNGSRSADLFLERVGADMNGLQIAAQVNDQETVKNMVAGGMGISIISEMAAHDFIEAKRVLKVDLSRFHEEKTFYLVYPASFTPKHHAWNFIDYASVSKEFFWTKN